MSQMFLPIEDVIQDKEDIKAVMKELSCTCSDCRLGILHPNNRGVIWRGNIEAPIAIIGEAPGDKETETGRPLVGRSGQEFERWAKLINLDTNKQCLLTNVAQCQPPKVKIKASKKDKAKDKELGEFINSQRAPDSDEINACFGPRALRIMKAMPNLEVVLTLGWVAAGSILGGDPKSRTHEGHWFESSLLPGIAVFCMIHPSYVIRDPTPEKLGKVEQALKMFKREYLESRKIVSIALEAKTKRENRNGREST